MPKTSEDQSKDTNTDSVRFAWTRQLKQAWTRLKNLARVWSGAALFLPAGAPCPTTMIWAWEGYGECKPEEESAMKVTVWLVSMYLHIFTYIYHYLLQSVHAFVTQKHIIPQDSWNITALAATVSRMYAFWPQNFHGVRCFYVLGLPKLAHRKGPKNKKMGFSLIIFFWAL